MLRRCVTFVSPSANYASELRAAGPVGHARRRDSNCPSGATKPASFPRGDRKRVKLALMTRPRVYVPAGRVGGEPRIEADRRRTHHLAEWSQKWSRNLRTVPSKRGCRRSHQASDAAIAGIRRIEADARGLSLRRRDRRVVNPVRAKTLRVWPSRACPEQSCAPVVLVDQPAEHLPTRDPRSSG
jgi:hypothetical protein